MKVTEQVINKLFGWMKKEYGGAWSGQYLQPGETDAAKAAWKKGLSRLTAADIAKGLKVIKQLYPKKPPDLDEFKAMVREAKRQKPGYLSNVIWEPPVNGPNAKKSSQRAYLNKIKEDLI